MLTLLLSYSWIQVEMLLCDMAEMVAGVLVVHGGVVDGEDVPGSSYHFLGSHCHSSPARLSHSLAP